MSAVFLAATLLAAVFLLHCAVVGGAVLAWLSPGGIGKAVLTAAGGAAAKIGPGTDSATGQGSDGARSPAGAGAAAPLGFQGPGPLTLFFAICLGMLVDMAALFALGLAGQLHTPGVAVMAAVLLGGSLALTRSRAGRRRVPATRPARVAAASGVAGHAPTRAYPAGMGETLINEGCATPAARLPALETAALAVLFLLCIAVSMHPPGHWDDTMYQLPLARHYVQQQAIALHEYLRFPLFPQNFNLLFALGLMLGDALPAWLGGGMAAEAAAVSALAAGTGLDAAAGAAASQALWRFGAPEVFAQVFASLPLFVMALGLWGASRRYMGSGIPGLLAGAMLFMIGPVKSTLGFAYVDNGLALFCWAAVLAVARMAERPAGPPAGVRGPRRQAARSSPENGSQAIAAPWPPAAGWLLPGLLAGAACGTKYFGVVFATLLGAAVIAVAAWRAWRARAGAGAASGSGNAAGAPSVALPAAPPVATPTSPSVASSIPAAASAPDPIFAAAPPAPGIPASILRAALVYGAAVFVAGGGWYLRSYLISGDPAHPAGASLFGFFLWNEGDLAWQHAEQAQHGVARNPLLLPAALLDAGVLPWLPAFAGLFLRRLPPAIRLLQAVFVAYMLFWFFVTQVPRYLAPVYGLGGFLALHALHCGWVWAAPRVAARPWPRFTATSRHRAWPAALALILVAGYTAERAVKYGREFVHSEAVLATNGGYALYQQANLHAPEFGSRLVQVGFEDGIYFFRGTVIGDWFGPGRYRDLLACDAGPPCRPPPGAALRAALQRHGSRMLLLSRRHVTGLDETALQAAGWRVLSGNENGVLLAMP